MPTTDMMTMATAYATYSSANQRVTDAIWMSMDQIYF